MGTGAGHCKTGYHRQTAGTELQRDWLMDMLLIGEMKILNNSGQEEISVTSRAERRIRQSRPVPIY